MTRPTPSKRTVAVVGIAAGVVGVIVGAVVLVRAAADDGGARPAAQRAAERPIDPGLAARVGDLARRADDQALVALYAAQGGARPKVIDALCARTDRHAALAAVLAAVASTPGTIADDPMVEYAAEKLLALWTDPALVRYARDQMLVQSSDKARAVLATSLATHTARLTAAQDPEQQTRSWMINDLVDLYAQCGDEAKTVVLAAVATLGGDDVAKALTGGGAAAEFEVVQHRADEMERAAEQYGGSGAALDHDAIMRQLGKP